MLCCVIADSVVMLIVVAPFHHIQRSYFFLGLANTKDAFTRAILSAEKTQATGPVATVPVATGPPNKMASFNCCNAQGTKVSSTATGNPY